MKIALTIVALMCSLTTMAKDNLLASGPMIGHVDIVEAHIWVQTTKPAAVHLEYWADGTKDKLKTEVIRTVKAKQHTALFVMTDLKDDTVYNYKLFINKKEVKRPYPLRFKTQLFWRYRTDPPEIRIAMGSCHYVNDQYARPGKPYGAEFEVFDQIVKENPDVMLWLGDNTYFRESDFWTPDRLAYRWAHTRAFEGHQELLAMSANYATWDDHDYGPNDSDRSYILKDVALDLFKNYWDSPSWGQPDNPGVYTRLSWGDLDIFFLDNRYHRAANKLKDPDKPFLGKKQLDWLKDNLLTSRAPFKLIVNGNQTINTFNPYEAWSAFTNEWNDFMHFLDTHTIPGIIFLSGDRHHSELLKMERPGNYPLYEFTSSPLSSGVANVAGTQEENNPLRVEGTLVNDKRNFGMIEVTGKRKERVLKMRIIDSTGAERWSHSLKEQDLVYKRPKRKPRTPKKKVDKK